VHGFLSDSDWDSEDSGQTEVPVRRSRRHQRTRSEASEALPVPQLSSTTLSPLVNDLGLTTTPLPFPSRLPSPTAAPVLSIPSRQTEPIMTTRNTIVPENYAPFVMPDPPLNSVRTLYSSSTLEPAFYHDLQSYSTAINNHYEGHGITPRF